MPRFSDTIRYMITYSSNPTFNFKVGFRENCDYDIAQKKMLSSQSNSDSKYLCIFIIAKHNFQILFNIHLTPSQSRITEMFKNF